MADGILKRLFGRSDGRDAVRPLYNAIVIAARQPHWYLGGGVEDSMSGRFEMISAVFAVVLARMESLGEKARAPMALITECFIEDMDGQLRQSGVGDVGLSKQMGTVMAALGGRLGAYRDGLADAGALDDALIRNLYRGVAPSAEALGHSRDGLTTLQQQLQTRSLADLLEGQL
jgi:cytochrome b pre-mRNA-processing protein 3